MTRHLDRREFIPLAGLTTAGIAVAVLALAGQLHAADLLASRLADLRVAKERVARAAQETKGAPQHRLLQEQQKLNGLIDALEQGQRVDPQEIDRALQLAQQGTA
jgi:hypothetical protein